MAGGGAGEDQASPGPQAPGAAHAPGTDLAARLAALEARQTEAEARQDIQAEEVERLRGRVAPGR